ncbi:MAG: sodium:calcium antiporter, partial [Myxococcaceae bacterium]
AASLVAAARGQPSLAIGNVVGSNIFNVFFVLGAAALVSPLHMPFAEVRGDTYVLIGITVFSLLAMRRARTLGRTEGALMLACYLGFCVALARG